MSQSNPGMYDTQTLIHVVRNLKVPQKFLLNKFFTSIVTSDTEFVDIDVEIGLRRMAPFVSPLLEGKVVQQQRMQTNMFKPAYLKPKTPIDIRKPVRRAIGERIGGELSAQERAQANIVLTLEDHINQIDRRCEWMAACALSTGTVTITGDGFPTVVVDFGRDATLTVAKTGASKWTKANVLAGAASPSQDIESWGTQILQKSGAVCTDIIFTKSSWAGFIADPALAGAVVYPKLAEFGNGINPGAQIQLGGQYKGRWGNYDLWLYNDWFIDDNNVEQPMLPDGTVLMGGAQIEGVRGYGCIMDPQHNYQKLEYAPKIWTVEDPAQIIVMTQSSPIMIPSRPNASFSAMVI